MEFKVGDIVRCTNVDGETDYKGVGTHSIITEINLGHSWPINAVDIDGTHPGLEVACSESEIELVYRHNETVPLEDKLRELIEELRLSDQWVDSTIDYDAGHHNATSAAIKGIEDILKEFGNG